MSKEFTSLKNTPGNASNPDSFLIKLLNLVFWVFGIVLVLNTAILIFKSIDWPLFWDAPIYHYIAWMMNQGAVPYKDLFDQNFPGTYLVHYFAINIFGTGDLGWRIFDLSCLALTDFCIICYLKKYGKLPAIFAAGLFSVFHLLNGPPHAGQRDFIVVLLMIAGFCFLANGLERTLSPYRLFLAGLLIGAGTTIKPHIVFLFPMMVLLVTVAAYRLGRSWLRPCLAFVAGGLAVPAAIMLWLVAAGGLVPFLELLFKYLIPIYSHMARTPLLKAALEFFPLLGFPLIVEGLILGIVSLLYFLVQKQLDFRRGILVLGVFYGLFHYFSQGKAWVYHTYPLKLCMFLLAASWITLLQDRGQIKKFFILLVVTAHLGLGFCLRGAERIKNPHEYNIDYVQTLVDDLRDRLAPGDKIQTMFYHSTGVHAQLLLKQPQVTRFVLTFHVFNFINKPYIKKLRTEFLSKLMEQRPKVLVVSGHTTATTQDYRRIKEFPALQQWMKKNYRLVVDREDYRIYELNAKP